MRSKRATYAGAGLLALGVVALAAGALLPAPDPVVAAGAEVEAPPGDGPDSATLLAYGGGAMALLGVAGLAYGLRPGAYADRD